MVEAPRVTFVVAGAQKGGTTALFDYLGDWPEVALSDVKETHFFDDETQDWARPDYGAYHARFPHPDGRPCGEATPIYTYWPNALERIARYNPQMKVILVLRDPVARAWSHWRMETARGPERRPFSWCIRRGRMRLFETEPWGAHREFSYVERGYYGEQVERVFAVFPKPQVLILLSEALRADPAASLSEVRQFLGLHPASPPAPREIHVGEVIEGADLAPEDAAFLRQLYARDQERLFELTGLRFF